jgi:hypothetical protein
MGDLVDGLAIVACDDAVTASNSHCEFITAHFNFTSFTATPPLCLNLDYLTSAT